MTFSVDEAVARLFPYDVPSRPSTHVADLTDDDQWLAWVYNQQAQLHMSPMMKAMTKTMDFDKTVGITSFDPIHNVVPDVHLSLHSCSQLTMSSTAPTSPKVVNDRHQSPTNVDFAAISTHRSHSPSLHAKTSWRSRNVRPWTSDEHERFVAALERFRTDETERTLDNGFVSAGLGPGIADLIATVVGTRDAAQVRSHAQKHFQRLRREAAKKSAASA